MASSFFISLNILWSGDALSHQSLTFYTAYMGMGGGGNATVCMCICVHVYIFLHTFIGVTTAVLFLLSFIGLLRVLGFNI